MLCTESEKILIDTDFQNENLNDLDSSNIVLEIYDKGLKVIPSSNNSNFSKEISTTSVGSNLVDLYLKLGIKENSLFDQNDIEYYVDIFDSKNELKESFKISKENLFIDHTENTEFILERTFDYIEEEQLNIKFRIEKGYANVITFQKLKIRSYKGCMKEKTYFTIPEVFKLGYEGKNVALTGLSLKVDNQETLTDDFHLGCSSNLKSLKKELWLYKKFDIDNTLASTDENAVPNSFNPFIEDFNLEFSEIDKGICVGSNNGNNFGSGVELIGFDRNEIYNGNVERTNGVFYINIDYSKNFFFNFNFKAGSDKEGESFVNIDRDYFIDYNIDDCKMKFYYEDRLTGEVVDIEQNGFLKGLTPFEEFVVNVPPPPPDKPIFDASVNFFICFDGSGSMGSTLTPLTEVKNTLLKNKLLGFYNNDINLYNQKVQIKTFVDERCFKSMQVVDVQNTEKVICIVFQDESDKYTNAGRTELDDDITDLRIRLDEFPEFYYRSCLFVVEGGDTGQFKRKIIEVSSATGDRNLINLKDKSEVEYVYDILDGGVPQYYMDLIVQKLSDFGYNI